MSKLLVDCYFLFLCILSGKGTNENVRLATQSSHGDSSISPRDLTVVHLKNTETASIPSILPSEKLIPANSNGFPLLTNADISLSNPNLIPTVFNNVDTTVNSADAPPHYASSEGPLTNIDTLSNPKDSRSSNLIPSKVNDTFAIMNTESPHRKPIPDSISKEDDVIVPNTDNSNEYNPLLLKLNRLDTSLIPSISFNRKKLPITSANAISDNNPKFRAETGEFEADSDENRVDSNASRKGATKGTTKAAAKAGTKATTKATTKGAAKITSQATAKATTTVTTKAAAKTTTKAAAKTTAKVTTKAMTKAAAKATAKATTKATTKAAAKITTKAAAKTTAKATTKNAAKTTTKAAAKGTSKATTKAPAKTTAKATLKATAKTTAKGTHQKPTKKPAKTTTKKPAKTTKKTSGKKTTKKHSKTTTKKPHRPVNTTDQPRETDKPIVAPTTVKTEDKIISNREDNLEWTSDKTVDWINKYLENLARRFPKTTTLVTVGKSAEGVPIYAIEVVQMYVTGATIVIDGGMEATDRAGITFAIFVVHQLIERLNQNLLTLYGVKIIIVPLVNPDGYAKHLQGIQIDNCKQDFTTNFEIGTPTTDQGCIKGRSTHAETIALSAYYKKLTQFKLYINLMGGSASIYYSYGIHSGISVKSATMAQNMKAVLDSKGSVGVINIKSFYEYFKELVGTSVDWCYDKLKVQYTMQVWILKLNDHQAKLKAMTDYFEAVRYAILEVQLTDPEVAAAIYSDYNRIARITVNENLFIYIFLTLIYFK